MALSKVGAPHERRWIVASFLFCVGFKVNSGRCLVLHHQTAVCTCGVRHLCEGTARYFAVAGMIRPGREGVMPRGSTGGRMKKVGAASVCG